MGGMLCLHASHHTCHIVLKPDMQLEDMVVYVCVLVAMWQADVVIWACLQYASTCPCT